MGYYTQFETDLTAIPKLSSFEILEMRRFLDSHNIPIYDVNENGFWGFCEGKYYDCVGDIQHFLMNVVPEHIRLDGKIECSGEDSGDYWRIVVEGNSVTVQKGKIVYE